jgi:hypothetical protein
MVSGARAFDDACGAGVGFDSGRYRAGTKGRACAGGESAAKRSLCERSESLAERVIRARHTRARRLIKNIMGLKETPRRIQELPAEHFYKADANYGMGVAKGLGLDASKIFAHGARTQE